MSGRRVVALPCDEALHVLPVLERAGERLVVGVFEVRARWQAARESRHADICRCEEPAHVEGCSFSFEVWIGGHDDSRGRLRFATGP